MSGQGERIGDGDVQPEVDELHVAPGEPVFNDAGMRIGTVRGYEEGGFFVSTRRGIEQLSIEHARSGHYFGEAHLMWRCMICGEMGDLGEGVPDGCPLCGTEKEDIMWWTED